MTLKILVMYSTIQQNHCKERGKHLIILKLTVFIRINAQGGEMHFSKGGATITNKKTQLLSPVAMGDNGHIQP